MLHSVLASQATQFATRASAWQNTSHIFQRAKVQFFPPTFPNFSNIFSSTHNFTPYYIYYIAPSHRAAATCHHAAARSAAAARSPCRGSVAATLQQCGPLPGGRGRPASRPSRALPRWPPRCPLRLEKKTFSPHGWFSARCVSAEIFLKKSREKIWPCRSGAVILHRFSPQVGAPSARKSSLTWWREQQRCSTKGH